MMDKLKSGGGLSAAVLRSGAEEKRGAELKQKPPLSGRGEKACLRRFETLERSAVEGPAGGAVHRRH
jgi:hypothetical protein